MAPHQQLSPEEVMKAFEGIALSDLAGNHGWLGGTQPRLLKSTEMVGRLMHEARLLDRVPDLTSLCEPTFLPEVA